MKAQTVFVLLFEFSQVSNQDSQRVSVFCGSKTRITATSNPHFYVSRRQANTRRRRKIDHRSDNLQLPQAAKVDRFIFIFLRKKI
jgi:hypothetical protein